jgi:hypothetical protein
MQRDPRSSSVLPLPEINRSKCIGKTRHVLFSLLSLHTTTPNQVLLRILNLLECELLVEEKSQKKACKEEEIMAKGIKLFIVRTPDKRVVPHAPDDSEGAGNKHQFHNSIVD